MLLVVLLASRLDYFLSIVVVYNAEHEDLAQLRDDILDALVGTLLVSFVWGIRHM